MKLILPAGMGEELLPEDAEWLLERAKAWDKNILMVAKKGKVKPTLKLAIAVGKEMLKEKYGEGKILS